MVIVENKFTFVHIRKTGGTSVRTWIKTNFKKHTNVKNWHITLEEANAQGYKNFGWKFCIVRNTFDRLFSHYKFQKDRHYFKLQSLDYKDEWETIKTRTHIFEQDFEYWYDRQVDKGHYFTQIQYSRDCDHIIKFERLASNFRYIQWLTDCNQPLPFLNNTPDKRYKDIYTNRLISKVKKDYAEELEIFKYTF